MMRPKYFKIFLPSIFVHVPDIASLGELKSKRYHQISCLTINLQLSVLTLKAFYGVSTSIVLRLLKILHTLFSLVVFEKCFECQN